MSTDPTPTAAIDALAALWRAAALPDEALAQIELGGGAGPVLPSSFCVATAAQASLGAAALAAAELWRLRHPRQPRQRVAVDRSHATLESTGFFSIDGRVPAMWDPLSGLYRCGAGWVRIHANFAHHRDGALRLLGLAPGPQTGRDAVTEALSGASATDFEQAAADAGLAVAAARRFDEWDALAQARALATQPTVAIERIGDAPALPWPDAAPTERPLLGVRVLDLTRILAGPVAGRCLAAYGAEVMLVNAPHLPNIEAIADSSRGKLSAWIDLRDEAGRVQLDALIGSARVFLQGYRPGALAARGYGAEALAQRRPGIVVAELSAYGSAGPWAGRRGFDSLVQTATGFNLAEAEAAGSGDAPRPLPLQILDFGAGHLLAFGIQAALWRQAHSGGSWRVRVSLAGVGRWLRGLGRQADGLAARAPDRTPWLDTVDSGFGRLCAMRHAAVFSATPAGWVRPSMPPGSDPPRWPGEAG